MNRPGKSKALILSRSGMFLTALLLCLCVGTASASENTIAIEEVLKETQKISAESNEFLFIWWIPVEYWEINFSKDPTISEPQAEELTKTLRPYTLFAVADGDIGAFGGVTYKTMEETRAILKLIDSEGNHYQPLNEDKVDPDTKNFLSAMKPVLANAVGAFGENMHFFLFPAKNDKHRSIADPGQEGSFSVKLRTREFRWRLPLGSLLPPKTCPKCGEKLSGAYKFCPWDGSRLH